MILQPGDWVKSTTGEIGKVVHSSRLTVFVSVQVPEQPDNLKAILESQLTKIDPPPEPGPPVPKT
jgi:hypothetical protein